MRFGNTMNAIGEVAGDMTPMIDVIFQLVLFFVFSMKFFAFEGQLESYLPRDRGQQAAPGVADPRTVTVHLAWVDAEGGKVLARTERHESPAGKITENYQFPTDPGLRVESGPSGTIRAITEARVEGPGRPHTVTHEYAVPHWPAVEEFLAVRKRQYQSQGKGVASGLPVIVSFEKRVPWQAVVNVLDICTRLEIKDFALNLAEIEP